MAQYVAKSLETREKTAFENARESLAELQETLINEEGMAGPRNAQTRRDLKKKIFAKESLIEEITSGDYASTINKRDVKALERSEANLIESTKGLIERRGLPFLKDKFLKELAREDQSVDWLVWEDDTLWLYVDNESKVDAVEWSDHPVEKVYKVLETAPA